MYSIPTGPKGATKALLLIFCVAVSASCLPAEQFQLTGRFRRWKPKVWEEAEARARAAVGFRGSGGGGNASIPPVQHFVTVVLENSNYTDIVGSSNAPYINSLIATGGLAAD